MMAKALVIPSITSIAALVLDGATLVPLGAAMGCVAVMVSLTRRWTVLEMKLDAALNEIKNLSARIEKLENQKQEKHK